MSNPQEPGVGSPSPEQTPLTILGWVVRAGILLMLFLIPLAAYL